VPNVMDFESGPDRTGDGRLFRDLAGVSADDLVLLQPTRVIPRKGIEITLDLAAALDDPRVKVIITHRDGDEGHAYGQFLRSKAGELGVDLRNVPVPHVAATPGEPALADAYAAADVVCFPSLYEGFGNAILETFFYRRPIFVNRYSAYVSDIAPTGVQCIEVNGGIDPIAVDEVARLLSDPGSAAEGIARNYEISTEHFSFKVLRERFVPLVEEVAAVGV
jgi:glycosyltransferase involved in cell wall biosynthesis